MATTPNVLMGLFTTLRWQEVTSPVSTWRRVPLWCWSRLPQVREHGVCGRTHKVAFG